MFFSRNFFKLNNFALSYCTKRRSFSVSNYFLALNKQRFTRSTKSSLLIGLGAGVSVGTVYSLYYNFYVNPTHNNDVILNYGAKLNVLKELPPYKVSRKVVYPTDSSGLKILLFQYSTCPFCCKVRAFLDYNGISYDVIEVNPVLRQQLRWTDYKKVPVILVKTSEGYLQLSDSTMITSALKSYLHDNDNNLGEIANFYPTVNYIDDDGSKKSEILNRYHVMYKNIPKHLTAKEIEDEKKWRKWADNVLVHSLSPNVYRTVDESLQAFQWFSQAGEWEKYFYTWERYLVIYTGAFVMWIIGKRLKKRYRLKDDVRQTLYDQCSTWTNLLKSKGTTFHGGSKPDLADLAVYGVLSSIEGCHTFSDLLHNTKIGLWYKSMKENINIHTGSNTSATILNG